MEQASYGILGFGVVPVATSLAISVATKVTKPPPGQSSVERTKKMMLVGAGVAGAITLGAWYFGRKGSSSQKAMATGLEIGGAVFGVSLLYGGLTYNGPGLLSGGDMVTTASTGLLQAARSPAQAIKSLPLPSSRQRLTEADLRHLASRVPMH